MSLKQVRTIGTDDATLTRIQDNLATAIDGVIELPLVNGILLESIVLTAGVETLVAHKLLAKPRGWIVVKKRPKTAPPATVIYVWDVDAPTRYENVYLSMWASTDCTVSLWVF